MQEDTKLDPEMEAAAKTIVDSYQAIIDKIRDGRHEAGFKLNDMWNDWYNGLMAICFALGAAVITIAATVTFKSGSSKALLLVSGILFLVDGLYILLLRKHRLERESVGLIRMGYEMEYYASVAKNRTLDVLAGRNFNEQEFTDAKNKLLDNALTSLDDSYEETRAIDEHMDVMVLIFILGIILTTLSSISDNDLLKIAGLISATIYVILLFVFRAFANRPKAAIAERDKWLKKITKERKSYSEK